MTLSADTRRGRPLPTLGGAVAAPPYSLPAAHFLATLAWLFVVAVLLPLSVPALLTGTVFAPRVFALVHAAMLGVVGSAVVGTLQQFAPGGLGVPLRSVRLGFVAGALFQGGVVVLVTGFLSWLPALQGVGWALVVVAVALVGLNVSGIRQSVHGQQVAHYLAAAFASLAGGLGIAAIRIGATLGWWSADRTVLLGAHALLGALGFGTLTVVGVGSRMLPTFLLAPGDDSQRLRWILRLTCAALGEFAIGASGYASPRRHAVSVWVLHGAGATLLLAVALMLALLWRWYARRARALDRALQQVATAVVALGVAWMIGVLLLVSGRIDLTLWIALLLLAVLGWLIPAVLGVMAKIFPHLSYRHARAFPGFAARGSPNALLHAGAQRASTVLHSVGLALLVGGLVAARAPLAALGALIWSGGAVIGAGLYLHMFAAGRRRPSTAATLPVAAPPAA